MFVAIQTWKTPVVLVDSPAVSPVVVPGMIVYTPQVFIVPEEVIVSGKGDVSLDLDPITGRVTVKGPLDSDPTRKIKFEVTS